MFLSRFQALNAFCLSVLGSTSHQAGLERNDHIIRINGQNVTKFDMAYVAAFVKRCDRQMVIDVHRFKLGSFPVENGFPINIGTRATCHQGVNADFNGIEQQQQQQHTQHGFVDIIPQQHQCKQIGSSESSGKSSGFSSWNDDVISDSESDAMTSYSCEGMPPVLEPWKRVPNADPWFLYHQMKQKQAQLQHQCSGRGDSCESDTDCSYFTDTESCYSCSTYNLNKENLPHSKQMRFSNSPPPPQKSDVAVEKNNNNCPEYAQVKKKGLSYRETKDPNIPSDSPAPLIPPRKPQAKSSIEKVVPPVPKGEDRDRTAASIHNNNDSQLSEDSGLEMASQLPLSYHVSNVM